MPVIHTYASTPIPEEARESLKAVYGTAIEAVPGKSEQWLMCLFEGDTPIYHAGSADAPAALVTVDVYATEPVEPGAFKKMTPAICSALQQELGIDPARIYIRYGTTPDFGWNNMNF